MKTYKDLISRWDACNGGQLPVDHRHPIKNMYPWGLRGLG